MNILEVLRRDETAMRRRLAEMKREAGQAEDVGSADYFRDGGAGLMRELKSFQAALERHRGLEERFVADLAREPVQDGDVMADALARGEREVEESARWLETVSTMAGAGRAYRMRRMLNLLVQDLECHLDCEERVAAQLSVSL